MSIQVIKLELIQWILLLKDTQFLNEVQKLKEKSPEKTDVLKPRQFGCGKGIFTCVADDFDETHPGFEEYMLP
ncbi:hypothetical protein [Tychonema sp. LEGE 07203]|uniref:hypothetical protein n=1 Tax=Tychonema sp. LEGE 07203 TaxID=1828671 RepID=UPI001880A167|nr:hypothetical protein [Tychonema sp. LEGE 07203]MBE9094039.1 hypothetical protein [Tychonema sp. LEGE 07203]